MAILLPSLAYVSSLSTPHLPTPPGYVGARLQQTDEKPPEKQLVMNYLVVEGYREAAEHFVEESGTEAKVDLNTIQERVAIRKARPSRNVLHTKNHMVPNTRRPIQDGDVCVRMR